jgi:hypothetical protein
MGTDNLMVHPMNALKNWFWTLLLVLIIIRLRCQQKQKIAYKYSREQWQIDVIYLIQKHHGIQTRNKTKSVSNYPVWRYLLVLIKYIWP